MFEKYYNKIKKLTNFDKENILNENPDLSTTNASTAPFDSFILTSTIFPILVPSFMFIISFFCKSEILI